MCVPRWRFLVVQLIRIGRIDGIRPGIPGSVIGTDRVRPHHLIGVDWAQSQSSNLPSLPCLNAASSPAQEVLALY